MTKDDIIKKYSEKAEKQRELFGLCPHPNCDGHGKCLCCKNTDGCLDVAEECDTIVALLE